MILQNNLLLMTPSQLNSESPSQLSTESLNDAPGHTSNDSSDRYNVSCCGSYDPVTREYSFSAVSGGLCISFDFLKKEDIEEMKSCLECLLFSEQPEN